MGSLIYSEEPMGVKEERWGSRREGSGNWVWYAKSETIVLKNKMKNLEKIRK